MATDCSSHLIFLCSGSDSTVGGIEYPDPQVPGIVDESQWSPSGDFCDSCHSETRENASKTRCFTFTLPVG